MSCCCGRLPSYRGRSATLPRSEPLPTTTTGHYTICCKKPQYCAPEDGQNFARNMLSWSWRPIKLLLLHLVGFYITLPTLMMRGQTQIKFRNYLFYNDKLIWFSEVLRLREGMSFWKGSVVQWNYWHRDVLLGSVTNVKTLQGLSSAQLESLLWSNVAICFEYKQSSSGTSPYIWSESWW